MMSSQSPVSAVSPNCIHCISKLNPLYQQTVSVSTDNCNNPNTGTTGTAWRKYYFLSQSLHQWSQSEQLLCQCHHDRQLCCCQTRWCTLVTLWPGSLIHLNYMEHLTRLVGGGCLSNVQNTIHTICTHSPKHRVQLCTVEWFTFLASRLLLTRCQIIDRKSATSTSHICCLFDI